jgi:lysophospholipase L1-like esterase
MKIEADKTLLFIGDSITSAVRNFDCDGEGGDEAFGSGYVLVIKSMLEAFYPERRIRTINMGVGGHTVRDLAQRWQCDVLDRKPDWLSVMIGINDVWRQFDAPLRVDTHVYPDEYGETYRRILSAVRNELDGLVVVSPYVVDSVIDDPMRKRMDEYRKMASEIARELGAIYVDVQAAFDAYLQHYHSNTLCWDRIHVNMTGHMLIAQAWLQAVGFTWPAGMRSDAVVD